MTFSETMWSATDALQQSILIVPFNRELATGKLAPKTFRHYIIQDAHYLEGFARALALVASRAPDADAIMQLSGSANSAIAVERQLHGPYMDYTESMQHLLPRPSRHQYATIISATFCVQQRLLICLKRLLRLLPCFWVYLRVGQDIHARASSDNPYRAWIDTYAGADFASGVEQMLELTNRVAKTAGDANRARMHHAFRQSTRLEWMFWDSAYHCRRWMVPDSNP
ncbi:MAG: TenA family protein [Rickettsiales bacterium]|jgi:thiaminase (transcriptional activator TenA)|nr:TenA family protein [Rickettsiales bacterium]